MEAFRNPEDIHEPVGAYIHQIEIRGNDAAHCRASSTAANKLFQLVPMFDVTQPVFDRSFYD